MPLHHCRVQRVFGHGQGADNNSQGTLFTVSHLYLMITAAYKSCVVNHFYVHLV